MLRNVPSETKNRFSWENPKTYSREMTSRQKRNSAVTCLLTQSETSSNEAAFAFKFLATHDQSLSQSNRSVDERKRPGTQPIDGQVQSTLVMLCVIRNSRMKFAEREMRARSNAIDRRGQRPAVDEAQKPKFFGERYAAISFTTEPVMEKLSYSGDVFASPRATR